MLLTLMLPGRPPLRRGHHLRSGAGLRAGGLSGRQPEAQEGRGAEHQQRRPGLHV